MTELEKAYVQRFNAHKRKLDAVYLDALVWLYGYEENYFFKIRDNFVILPPTSSFVEQLTLLVNQNRFGEIFGKKLGGKNCFFEPFGCLELKLDNLHVFEFPPSEWLEAASSNQQVLVNRIQNVRKGLGPLFPDKIKGYTVVVADMKDPNGKRVDLTTYDEIEGKNLERLLQLYANWFACHSQRLTLMFQNIADEIIDWQKTGFNIKPNKNLFVDWFMTTKLKSVITLQADQNSSGQYDIKFGFDMLYDTLTPTVVEQDLYDFCRWREAEHKKAQNSNISERGLSARQKILIHCYEDKEPIKKGDPRYNDYITFATPSKRIAYPNESASKAKHLISDIEKILQFLNKKSAQQASNELQTLRTKI